MQRIIRTLALILSAMTSAASAVPAPNDDTAEQMMEECRLICAQAEEDGMHLSHLDNVDTTRYLHLVERLLTIGHYREVEFVDVLLPVGGEDWSDAENWQGAEALGEDIFTRLGWRAHTGLIRPYTPWGHDPSRMSNDLVGLTACSFMISFTGTDADIRTINDLIRSRPEYGWSGKMTIDIDSPPDLTEPEPVNPEP